MENIIEITKFKKEMNKYFKENIDATPGTIFAYWFADMVDDLKRKGKVIEKDGETYIVR